MEKGRFGKLTRGGFPAERLHSRRNIKILKMGFFGRAFSRALSRVFLGNFGKVSF
jgi:hypothetical protein